jgi:hypothetical protein
MSAWYFLFFAMLSMLLPFYPIILSAPPLSLGPTAIGALLAARSALAVTVGPMRSAAFDAHRFSRLSSLLTGMFFYGVSTVVLLVVLSGAVPSLEPVLPNWARFAVVFVWLITRETSVQGIDSFASTLTLRAVKLTKEAAAERGETSNAGYGRMRLWGAVSWALGAAYVGAVTPEDTPFVVAAASQIGLLLACAALAVFVIEPTLDMSAIPSTQEAGVQIPWYRALASVGRQPEVASFFVLVTSIGVAMGINNSVLFLHLSELGVSNTVLGMSVFLTAIAEMPFFFYASKLIAYFSARGVVNIAAATMVFRLLYYSLLGPVIVDPDWVLLVEPLHGITFAAMWTASVTYAEEIAPPGLAVSMQGLCSGLHWGLGAGAGALIGGALMPVIGATRTFVATAISLATVVASVVLVQRVCAGKAAEGDTEAILDGTDLEEVDTSTVDEAEGVAGSDDDDGELEEIDLGSPLQLH